MRHPAGLLVLLVLLGLPSNAAGDSLTHRAPGRYVQGELLVRFKPGAGIAAQAAVRRSHSVLRVHELPVSGLRVVNLRRGESVQAAKAAFERDPAVLYAEPNFYYELAGMPNDSRFGELWGLNSTGQVVDGAGGLSDADIDAPEAWQVTTGRRNVIVAVADSGIAYDHPDLRSNVWTNPGETGGGRQSNGRDDDRDGLVDDWRGWDFVANDNDARDVNGHGTHVAGTIGAPGNNGSGVTGVTWHSKLMPLRVADGGGTVTTDAIISAFDYAAAKGARIVNASFTSSGFSQALLDAIRRNPRMLVVAAAGNGGDDGAGDDNDQSPQYPCEFPAPNVICVGASDRSDKLTSFSNYGRLSVDLAAPGAGVLSTTPAYTAPLFSEGFESDIAGRWLTGGTNDTWGRVSTVAHGGAFSLSDSPGTSYLDGTDSFARTASPFNLSGRSGCRLNYALRLSTEFGPDRLLVEVSRDLSNWGAVAELSGSTGGNFFDLSEDISDLDGAPSLYLRYHLNTNASLVSDGAQVDDIDIRCLSSTYTGAEFGFKDGTSMAAPYVSGTAALILSQYPALGAAGVRKAIMRGAERKSVLAGKTVSGGRLNAHRALREARKLVPRVDLSGSSRQHGVDRHGVIVYARCTKTCALIATGRLVVSGSSKVLSLKKVARSLPGGKRKRLALKLSGAAASTAGRALARRRHVTATVTATATDRHGNSVQARRTVLLSR